MLSEYSIRRVCVVWFVFLVQVCRAYKNVLFLSVDDLRPELGAYVDKTTAPPLNPGIFTPNIDKLASKSLVLRKAYVQYPLCAPSRASILTGRRPDTTKVYGFHQNFRKRSGNFTTIPQYFKEHGYTTIGFGKIFHDGPEQWNDDPISWSEPFMRINSTIENNKRSWTAVPNNQMQKDSLRDERVADSAIKALKKLAPKAKSGSTPFFLAAGFYKPHLPFVFPESMLKYYPKDSIFMPKNSYIPDKMPKRAWSKCQFLKKSSDIKALNMTFDFNTSLPDWKTLELRRAYYSAVTFVDFHLGRILNELERLDLVSSTVILFWSDHGFHLGENREWGKVTFFQMSTWAPLMISISGLTDHGIMSHQLVEFVDIYPTLIEATGHRPPPLCPKSSKLIKYCVEGISFLKLIERPFEPVKTAAFSQILGKKGTMAYTIITKEYRYTEYLTFNPATLTANRIIKDVELYDLSVDPWENFNVAKNVEYYDTRLELSKILERGWRSSILKHSDNNISNKRNSTYMYTKNEINYNYNIEKIALLSLCALGILYSLKYTSKRFFNTGVRILTKR